MPVLRDVQAMNYADIELGLAALGEKVCFYLFHTLHNYLPCHTIHWLKLCVV